MLQEQTAAAEVPDATTDDANKDGQEALVVKKEAHAAGHDDSSGDDAAGTTDMAGEVVDGVKWVAKVRLNTALFHTTDDNGHIASKMLCCWQKAESACAVGVLWREKCDSILCYGWTLL